VHSAFPIGTGLLTTPFAALAARLRPELLLPSGLLAFEKLLAAWLTATVAAALFLVLSRRFGSRRALLPALAFAVATPAVTCLSQGLWTATGAACMTIALFGAVLARRPGPMAFGVAAVASCGLLLCRPQEILVAVTVLTASRPQARRLLSSAALLGIAGGALLNAWLSGRALGGYWQINTAGVGFSLAGFPSGLLGVLFSPSRGLLVFLPWLLVAGVGFARARTVSVRFRWFVAAPLVAAVLLCAAYGRWWGGFSFGPRLLAASSPLYAILLLGLPRRRPPGRRAAAALLLALLGWSAGLQCLGFQRKVAWGWNEVADPDRMPEVLWGVKNSQLAATVLPEWRFRPAPYSLKGRAAGAGHRWNRIDLARHANARYDGWLFPGQRLTEWVGAFPRLDPALLNRGDAVFAFLPRGDLNAVTLCGGDAPLAIELPEALRASSVELASSVQAPAGYASGARVAVLVLELDQPGEAAVRELALGRQVFAYDPNRRSNWPPPESVLAGRNHQRDVLLRLSQRIPSGAPPLRRLKLEIAERDPALCLAVLAMSIGVN